MYHAAIFLPLLGFLIAGLFGKTIGTRGVNLVTCGLMLASAVCSALIFHDIALAGTTHSLHLLNWIDSGSFQAHWHLRFDTLTAVMLVVVTFVSTAVHIYSVGYMSHDPKRSLFMAYLSLFTFCMLMLVTADNFIQLFFGWEGVGLASYLLIGFWNHKHSANAAAMKAFIVNRVGDLGLALGIFAVFMVFGSVKFDTVFQAAASKEFLTVTAFGAEFHALTLICLLLFIGAVGKSAQLGLHTWLPDAMEGPTPVSALIHAATMVTAGVFLVCRISPMLEYAPFARDVIVFVGAATAIFAATIGLVQNDIKRVIAYSTCSQLGYMIFAAGVSAYSAAVFHLFTHAFFKALLFLGAGSVIHAMSNEQDMRKMGGLYKLVPVSYILMMIGSLALAGIWPFAGFWSKDMVLEAAYSQGTNLGMTTYYVGVAAALLTAIYSWRLLVMTFHGKPRASDTVMGHVHESPLVMLLPLFFLAVLAVGAGYWGYSYFVGDLRQAFWGESLFVLPQNDTVEAAHHVEFWVKALPIGIAALGILLGYLFYLFFPSIPGKVAENAKGLYRFLEKKWYFDELYQALFVGPAQALGRVFSSCVDRGLIDRFGPNGAAFGTQRLAGVASRVQTGYVYHYAFVIFIGLTLLVSWYVFLYSGV